MKIDERLEQMQSKLMRILAECDTNDKEKAIKQLEQFGLDNDSATKLLEAFKIAEDAKYAVKNVWSDAMGQTKLDNSLDIAKYQQQEEETRQNFDEINARCALIMVSRVIEPRAIDDEILDKLYEQGIVESQIPNAALRVAYHYYSESRAKDNEKGAEARAIRELKIKATRIIINLKNKVLELEKKYQDLEVAYRTLQNKYYERTETDEKYYQEALLKITLLENKLSRMQNKSIFQFIKLKFGNKRKELPEARTKLPSSLRENAAEKMGIKQIGENLEVSVEKNEKRSTEEKEPTQH